MTWTSQGLTGNVLVLLSNSTGDTSCTIGTALAQSHQYVYTPTLNSCLKRPGQYKIQVAKMSPTGGFDFNVEAFSNGTIAISAPNLSTTPVVVPTVVITNPPVTQVQITSASITPTQATINSNNPYVFNLAYPSNATDATISVSCPSFVGGPSCNTGPTHVLGSNSWPLAMFYQMSTSSQQVTVTYNVFSPQGNTSAQAMVTVQPMGR